MILDNYCLIVRILDILEVLVEFENGYIFIEIVDVINVLKSSIFFIVYIFNVRKYIIIDKNIFKYFIGICFYILGFLFFEKRIIFNYIIDEMINIVNFCFEICQFGIFDNNEVFYIGKVDFLELIRFIFYVGKKIFVNCIGFGKVFLCDFDKEKLISLYLDGLKGFIEKLIIDFDVLYDQFFEV